MSDANLSILSDQRRSPTGEPEVYTGELKRCHNFACSFETFEEIKKCPTCGRNMLGSSDFKFLGGILVVLGVILLSLGGAGLYFLDRMTPNGGERRAVLFIISASVATAGIFASGAGLYQMFSGNKSHKLARAMLYSFGAIILVVIIVRFLFDL